MTKTIVFGALSLALIGVSGVYGYQTGFDKARGFIGCEQGHLIIRNIQVSAPFSEPVINIPTDPCSGREGVTQ